MVCQIPTIFFGSDKRFYGREWQRDALDCEADNALLTCVEKLTTNEKRRPIVAVEIGCATGRRVKELAMLGIFDKIIAIDIGDRGHLIKNINNQLSTANHESHVVSNIEFREVDVRSLQPDDFEGMDVRHWNMRNVGHFLSAKDFRDSLKLASEVVSSGGIITVSYDCVRRDEFADYQNFDDNGDDFYQNPERIERGLAPYGRYRDVDPINFMSSSLGLETQEIKGTGPDFRSVECRVLARVPYMEDCKRSVAASTKKHKSEFNFV